MARRRRASARGRARSNSLKTSTQRRRGGSRRSGLVFEVKSSVMREIWAVIYLGLAVVLFLSIRNAFGILGEILMTSFRPVFGWGIFLLPVLFVLSSLLLFFSKKVVFPLSRIVGIFFLFVSILSIIHLSVSMDELYNSASHGQYGGYVGFVTNFLLRQVLGIGSAGAAAIFITLLVIAILLTFEISLGSIFSLFNPKIRLVRRREAKEELLEEEFENEEKNQRDFDAENWSEDEDFASQPVIRRVQIAASDLGDEIDEERVVPTLAETDAGAGSASIRAVAVVPDAEKSKNTALVEKAGEEYFDWTFPSLDLLNPAVATVGSDDAFLTDNAEKIRTKLGQFGINVAMHEVHVGPTVLQYTLRPSEGIKLSKITALKNDLALALAAKAVRIEAPIPGKSLVGIEVPNDHRSLVHLREILESKEYKEIRSNLRLPLGRDVSGKPMCGDLASMPPLLIAGATGSGKSVGMNTFLISLLYQNSPADLKLILVDPKRVELNSYNGIPHLLTPVVTDPGKAAIALRWAVAEMNRRYQTFAENRHRNIEDYNGCQEAHEEGSPAFAEAAAGPGHRKMPVIVIVIDELADLMMAAGKEVEASICRIAQMARAVGMYLVVATQRPSVDVITGLIKANIPARIAFAVSSSVDSRTILDGIGAEDLLGKGDMLYLPGGMSKPVRIQGIYISSKEIERVTNNIKISAAPNYLDEIISTKVAQEAVAGIPASALGEDQEDDENLYQQAVQVVVESRKASASLLQRRLKVGYARAARLLDMMEQNGMIGPVNGAKARDIYV